MISLGKTPYEFKLEEENQRLKSELEYFRRGVGKTYLTTEDAEVLVGQPITATLNLAASAELLSKDLGFHICAIEHNQSECMRIAYYISPQMILERADRANILQQLSDRCLKHLADLI